jgi:hypothetical protein
MMRANPHEGLPVGAEVVLARIDGQVKVGVAVIGSHPGSVQADPRDWLGRRLKLRVILHEIYDRLATLRLSGRMLRLVGLDVKLNVGGAAAWGDGGRNVLRQSSCCEQKQK